ncbi:MAG: GtrA family protein [Lachnospiraceae bacterium]|nr:GtrA family protein [Lachnospiraceae bacterium]
MKLKEHRIFGKLVNYEIITYLIAGVLTTVVSYGTYFLVRIFFREDYGVIVAQVISWITAVLFAYVVNKIFVFDSPSWSAKTLIREFLPFITARILSFLFDTAFVYVTVVVFRWNEPLMKILSNVIVLIINFVASKFIVFKKPKKQED